MIRAIMSRGGCQMKREGDFARKAAKKETDEVESFYRLTGGTGPS